MDPRERERKGRLHGIDGERVLQQSTGSVDALLLEEQRDIGLARAGVRRIGLQRRGELGLRLRDAAVAEEECRAPEILARRAGLATDTWRTQLLWTGAKTDIETIVGAYPALQQLGAELPLTLHCVAAPEVIDALREQVREDAADAVRLSFDVASSQVLSQALEACDFLLLPREARLQRAALQAGRHAIVGDNPCEAIRRALAHPRETLESLQRAQQHLEETHAPAVVARAWVRIFMKGPR